MMGCKVLQALTLGLPGMKIRGSYNVISMLWAALDIASRLREREREREREIVPIPSHLGQSRTSQQGHASRAAGERERTAYER
jgi:hypothetical protein